MRAPAQKKFIPPTLDDVNAYIMERGLHVSAKDFLDYFTETGWVDAKGQRVKSWKGKILTWEKFQPKLSTKQSTGNPQNPQKAIDDAIEYFENREEGTA